MTTTAPEPTVGAARLEVAPVRRAPKGFRADVRAVKIVTHRELLRTGADRGRLLTGLVQPFLFLFVLGAGLSSVVSAGLPGVDFQTFLFPGVLCTSVLFTGVFAGVSIVWDREFGFLREMLVAPIRRSSILIGKCLGGALGGHGAGAHRAPLRRAGRRALLAGAVRSSCSGSCSWSRSPSVPSACSWGPRSGTCRP